MARTVMTMNNGRRISEHLSIGLLAKTYTREHIRSILERLGRQSQRVRDLPAEVMVYYVIAMGLFMAVSTGEVLRCLVEGLQRLKIGTGLRVSGKGGISNGRVRLGAAPLRLLWEESCRFVGSEGQAGCFYRGHRLMAIDGSTMELQDMAENLSHFGKPSASRGKSAFPQLRMVSLCECGPHAIYATYLAPYAQPELRLAEKLLPHLRPGMLCLADRLYGNFPLWQKASQTGAHLLWRVRCKAQLPVEVELADGSYLTTLYPSQSARRHRRDGIQVRVITYQLQGVQNAEPEYRLVTTLLNPVEAPAEELAAVYPQRWEMEGVLDELKTHLRGGKIVLRSKTPELVEQEFYGLMLAHRMVRTLMSEAAEQASIDPDRLSFTHSVRVIRRKLASVPAFSPS